MYVNMHYGNNLLIWLRKFKHLHYHFFPVVCGLHPLFVPGRDFSQMELNQIDSGVDTKAFQSD